MRIVELILDEDQEIGIEAISVVENPAIEEDFIALKSQEFKLAEVDKERRILMGALLIPNKPIYRRNGEDEYYIYFSKDTVLKASQMYLTQGKQNNSTLEHQYADPRTSSRAQLAPIPGFASLQTSVAQLKSRKVV